MTLIGWGNLGLIEAPSKVTLSRGFRLSTVANQWMRKHIYDGLASLVGVVYYPERKQGRSVVYAVDVEGTRRLLAFLVEDCCQGKPKVCQPLIAAALADCC